MRRVWMRTTLKSGALRAGASQEWPLSPVEPTRRYRTPETPGRPFGSLLLRMLGWLLLALAVVAAGLGGGLYLYAHETLNAIAPRSKEMIAATRTLKPPVVGKPATALVIGYDARAGPDRLPLSQSRSDTLLLARADPQLSTLSLLSFPRDLVVPIYCKGRRLGRGRINSAWARCKGPQGTLDTVRKLTGIDVNYVVTVDFHGFKLLVNKLKGVYVTVDHRYINTHGGSCASCFARIDLEPGYQKLDGQDALDFVRFRHTDSDLYRLARQQLFLEALKDRLAASLSIREIPRIVGALKRSVEIGRGSGGPVRMAEIQAYAGLAYHLGGGHVFRVEIPHVYDCYVGGPECAARADIRAAVGRFEQPDVSLPARANAVALGREPTTPLKPSQVSALVLDGTARLGAARTLSSRLAAAGYRTVRLPAAVLAGARTPGGTQSTIYYDPSRAAGRRAATTLKAALGPRADVAPFTPQIASYAQQAGSPLTVVVVGASFGGTIRLAPPHVAPPPVREPAAVAANPALTEALLAGVGRRARFRLLVPRLVERTSQLALLEPLRVFRPSAGTTEVVLTFVTGAGNVYWNVVETDWTSAPILRRPTDRRVIGRRAFDLFTTGGHIHMVVLRRGGASYWVVNTLRDELSNETMLAIARGLGPLPRG